MTGTVAAWTALLSMLILLAAFALAYLRMQNGYGRAIKHATIDALTGLYDIRTGEKMMRVMLSKIRQGRLVLAMLDLDDITHLRESCGDEVCENMVRETARKLAADISGRGNICHVLNDTFLIAIPYEGSDDEALERVERLRLLCSGQLLDRTRARVAVHASAGAAIYPANGRTYQELYEKADMALFWSKRDGKDRLTVYKE